MFILWSIRAAFCLILLLFVILFFCWSALLSFCRYCANFVQLFINFKMFVFCWYSCLFSSGFFGIYLECARKNNVFVDARASLNIFCLMWEFHSCSGWFVSWFQSSQEAFHIRSWIQQWLLSSSPELAIDGRRQWRRLHKQQHQWRRMLFSIIFAQPWLPWRRQWWRLLPQPRRRCCSITVAQPRLPWRRQCWRRLPQPRRRQGRRLHCRPRRRRRCESFIFAVFVDVRDSFICSVNAAEFHLLVM